MQPYTVLKSIFHLALKKNSKSIHYDLWQRKEAQIFFDFMQYSFYMSNVLPAAMLLEEGECVSALPLTDLQRLMSFSYLLSFFPGFN